MGIKIAHFFVILSFILFRCALSLGSEKEVNEHSGEKQALFSISIIRRQMDVITPITTIPTLNPTPMTPILNPTVSNPNSPTTTNPTMTPATTTTTTTSPSSSGGSWCVASQSASQTALQVALDYACGYGGADCSAIQPTGGCYNPNTLRDHASFAFNNYYQKNPVPTGCTFGGSAVITSTDPSSGTCQYPTTSTSSSILNTTNSNGATVFGAGPANPTSSAAKECEEDSFWLEDEKLPSFGTCESVHKSLNILDHLYAVEIKSVALCQVEMRNLSLDWALIIYEGFVRIMSVGCVCD